MYRFETNLDVSDDVQLWAAPGNAFVIERHCLIIFRNVYNAGLQTPQRSTSTFLR